LKGFGLRLIYGGAQSNGGGAEGNATLTLTSHSNATRNADGRAAGAGALDSLSRAILSSLEDAKAENIVSIDLSGKTTIADRMIIASGRSSTHVGAIADRVAKACREGGFAPPKVEGMAVCDWVLLDARDTIVHIFRPDVREFYNLEKIWGADRPGEVRGG
jgi:ribosome-associated protein